MGYMKSWSTFCNLQEIWIKAEEQFSKMHVYFLHNKLILIIVANKIFFQWMFEWKNIKYLPSRFLFNNLLSTYLLNANIKHFVKDKKMCSHSFSTNSFVIITIMYIPLLREQIVDKLCWKNNKCNLSSYNW